MPAIDDEQYRRDLVKRAAAVLRSFPNVHSVGIGGRYRGGQPVGGIVLKVFVSTKKPPSQLLPGEIVPAQIEGLPTDVEECAPFEPDQLPAEPLPGSPPTVKADRDRYRPLLGGIQIVGANHSGSGTMGLILVSDDPGGTAVYGATNFHVLFPLGFSEQAAMKIGQPKPEGSLSGCCPGLVATYTAGLFDLEVDGAIFQLDAGLEYLGEIEELGIVTGTHRITLAEAAEPHTYQVRKRGCRTQKTGGVVMAINMEDVLGGRPLLNGISIRPNPSRADPDAFVRWSDFGDSGSAVINDANEVVGMHFFGNHVGPTNGWGVAFPIDDFLTSFATKKGIALRVATATAIGQTKTVPGARPANTGDLVATIDPEVEADLAATANGRLLTTLWLDNGGDAQRLINTNRKAATLWHRNNGPTLLSCLMRSAANRDRPMPTELKGKDVDACVADILNIFSRYGSDELKEAASIYRAKVPPLAGKSFGEIVSEL